MSKKNIKQERKRKEKRAIKNQIKKGEKIIKR
jgi:hypothetical protein